MICKKCGSVNNDDDNFCWNCGDDLQAQIKHVEQPKPQPQFQTVNTPINNTYNPTYAATSAPSNEQVLHSAKKLALLSYCFFAGFIASSFIRIVLSITLSTFDSFLSAAINSIVSLIGSGLYVASLVLAIIGKVKIYNRKIKCGMVTGALWMNIGFLIATVLISIIVVVGLFALIFSVTNY